MAYKFLRDLITSTAVTTIMISSLPHLVDAQMASTRDFAKENARVSQDWIKDAVIYEVFPRQFSAEGNFNGITKDLDRLQRLGVTVLWLMPIHPIGEAKRKGAVGSPYAVKDFYAINPDYGTAADLKRLVAESHKRGIKVIIDIVANHTAWDSVMMKTPAFYSKNDKGEIISPVPDWADVADLNYDNPELRKYMIEMLKYWVREFDLDGFRCDVAGFVPTDFWEQARAEVDKVKAETIWLAEWESPDLLVNAFNLDYSWAMHATLDKVFHGDAPASDIRKTWEADKSKMPKNALRMRFSDNHDERRAIARFGEKGALAAQALAFTLDGVPMFYNGMEVGDTAESGAPALFEKLPIFWSIAERRQAFPKFYEQMVSLRRDHIALRRGELKWVKNSSDDAVLTFTRETANETIFVAINTRNEPLMLTVEAAGKFVELTGDAKGKEASLPALSLDAFQYRIFKRVN